MQYQAKIGTILYPSKMHPVPEPNCEVFSATDWLAPLTAHIPNAGEHPVRHYGWYSNVSRGKRRKAQGEEPTTAEEGNEVSPAGATRAWARLIKQVYDVDPLVCPQCAGLMRALTCIEQPEVIKKIPAHLGFGPAPSHGAPESALVAARSMIASYHPVTIITARTDKTPPGARRRMFTSFLQSGVDSSGPLRGPWELWV